MSNMATCPGGCGTFIYLACSEFFEQRSADWVNGEPVYGPEIEHTRERCAGISGVADLIVTAKELVGHPTISGFRDKDALLGRQRRAVDRAIDTVEKKRKD